MATFNITDSSTVESFSKAFKDEFGATLQIYDGRLKADDSVKLVDLGAKTGSFECRASRTVGSFVKMMNDDFNLKVKVRTADDWVTVIDGLTLNRINDLPKQPTKTQMEDFVGYQRKENASKEENQEKTSKELYKGVIEPLEFTKEEKEAALNLDLDALVLVRKLKDISEWQVLQEYIETEKRDSGYVLIYDRDRGDRILLEPDQVDRLGDERYMTNLADDRCMYPENLDIYYFNGEVGDGPRVNAKEFIEDTDASIYADLAALGIDENDRHVILSNQEIFDTLTHDTSSQVRGKFAVVYNGKIVPGTEENYIGVYYQ